MATDITINLTDEREAELITLAQEWSRLFPEDPQTPSQHLRAHVRSWLDMSIQQRADAERLGLRAAYKQATPEEQATIDSILEKYRNEQTVRITGR